MGVSGQRHAPAAHITVELFWETVVNHEEHLNSRSPGRDSDLGLPEYKAVVQTTQTRLYLIL
jgi:hypothetical protein